VPLPPQTFYRHDLVGCAVVTVSGAHIGIVARVEGSASASRLSIATPSGEVLIPLAAEICPVIDPGRRRIVVNPPEGLLELNRTAGN
jgi:16S rRNA processing protein RimM